MKKTLCLILIFSLLFAMVSCASDDKTEKEDIRKEMYEELSEYYEGKKLKSFLEAAAFNAIGTETDLSEFDVSELLSKQPSTVEEKAEYVISSVLLKSDVSGYVQELVSVCEMPDDINTVSLSKAMIALTVSGAEFAYEKTADSLLERFDMISGGSYEYPQTSTEKSKLDVKSSAWSLMAYSCIKNKIAAQKYEDWLHDGSLLYLFERINPFNLVEDETGEDSSVMTALILSAFMAAGVPMDGDNSAALLTGIKGFASGIGSDLNGYSTYKDENVTDEANAYVLFAVISTLYGCPFIAEND